VDRGGLGFDSIMGNGGPAAGSDHRSPEGQGWGWGGALLIGVEVVHRGKRGQQQRSVPFKAVEGDPVRGGTMQWGGGGGPQPNR
jgi:hypothetical protein